MEWAERLVADGVNVVLDKWDLKEGNDKFAFMERMVTDPDISHVLVIGDQRYADKADSRKSGVGTESQIISSEIYAKADQTKFVGLVCEFDSEGNACLPTFLKHTIWIDFSSPEAVNQHWEQLIRSLFGKPTHEKPKLGTPPVYLTSDSATPASPALAKYSSLKQAVLQGKPAIGFYRNDFLQAALAFADALRIRERPAVESMGPKVLEDCGKLKMVRDHLVDWVFLESTAGGSAEFGEALISTLEKLREIKSRPSEVTQWNETWFEAHAIFTYETFIYIVAALLKTGSLDVLHEVFASHYLLPESDRRGEKRFESFGCFYGYSKSLQEVLDPECVRLYSPAAALIKAQADRADISFKDVMQAELLIFLMAALDPNSGHWYPGTLHYSGYSHDFPLFLRATQRKGFQKLAIITGVSNADDLRNAIKSGLEGTGSNRWSDFRNSDVSFWQAWNMDNLDTLK